MPPTSRRLAQRSLNYSSSPAFCARSHAERARQAFSDVVTATSLTCVEVVLSLAQCIFPSAAGEQPPQLWKSSHRVFNDFNYLMADPARSELTISAFGGQRLRRPVSIGATALGAD